MVAVGGVRVGSGVGSGVDEPTVHAVTAVKTTVAVAMISFARPGIARVAAMLPNRSTVALPASSTTFIRLDEPNRM